MNDELIEVLKTIRKLSRGEAKRCWSEMTDIEKRLLKVIFKNTDIDAKYFIEESDFEKYDELRIEGLNIYFFKPYFEDFEKIHNMPEEFKEMYSYGGNPDEFLKLNDTEKRKYIRSLCLNIDDFYEYFDDETKMYMTQSDIEREEAEERFLEDEIEILSQDIDELETKNNRLERRLGSLVLDKKALNSELEKQKNESNSIISKLVKELYEEKLRYLVSIGLRNRNKLSRKVFLQYFTDEYFDDTDINRAMIFIKKHGIEIVDIKNNKIKPNIKLDYSKTNAFKDAVKASETNAFSVLDEWQDSLDKRR